MENPTKPTPPTNIDEILLLVDLDHDFLQWASKHLAANGLQILRCDDAAKAAKIIAKANVGVIVSNILLKPFSGLELTKQIRAHRPESQIILTANSPTTAQIIEATQAGAHEVLRRESLPFELRPTVENAFRIREERRLAEPPNITPTIHDGRVKIIGNSRPLQEVFKLVGRIALTETPVLITGESGTGKELVAKALHEYSHRSRQQLIILNCGAIPENLLESELFGHEKGSFTGAMNKRTGRFEQADGSTLFLDEIGDLPLTTQVKLLRVLQEGTFSRVGSNDTLQTNVRIITATHKNLAHEVEQGRFREDLYYRLNVIELKIPPLRERLEDITPLANFFLQRFAQKHNSSKVLQLSPEALERLQKHPWPGNVRELENTITRACSISHSQILLPEDIPFTQAPQKLTNHPNQIWEILWNLAPKDGTFPSWLHSQVAQNFLHLQGDDAHITQQLKISLQAWQHFSQP